MKLDVDNKDKIKIDDSTETIPKKRGYGLDQYYEEERMTNQAKREKKSKKQKKKRTAKQRIFLCFKILIVLVSLVIVAIILFFKTNLFQKYKELWVQTAMTTMNHQYLATWFLSDEEIAEIMKKLEVENNENSDSNNIVLKKSEKEEITVEKITGQGYVGYVMTIPDGSKVKLVDGRLSRKRLKTK